MITITGAEDTVSLRYRSLGLRDQIPPQGLHRQRAKRHARAVCGGVWGLRGGACRDGRRRRSRASAGELSAESPALAAGEQPQRRIEPPPSPDASRFASALLQGCSVVAQLLRRLVWRRADQHHPPIHPTTTYTGLELIPAQTRLAPISGLNAKACGAEKSRSRKG